MKTTQARPEKKYQDGRDELNLADFPISVLQRQQPLDKQGAKRDTAVYQASRYDSAARRRVQQKVTLETTARHGLPTPADENVILALLYVAKHAHDFAEPVVPFAPRQLFHIMGWAPNSRSYERLREVLRRLKALVIRYENSWWDIAGRGYEAEVATGIISEYELGRQVSGRKKGAATPSCWVCWTPHFQKSLHNGNLKKLDLERLFSLRLPTSQRMYRFLDKRFYPPHDPPAVEMDLQDFACGHIGLSPVGNVAELKRRLAPAIAELEGIGFIAPAGPAERYRKVKPRTWRVRFTAGPSFLASPAAGPSRVEPPPAPVPLPEPVPAVKEPAAAVSPEQALATDYYRRWSPQGAPPVGASDLAQAGEILKRYGAAMAQDLLPDLVQIVKKKWPDCKSFSGAVLKYLPDALRAYQHRQARHANRDQAKSQRQREEEEKTREQAERERLEAHWQALPEAERREIEEEVLGRHPDHKGRTALLKWLCLKELARLTPAGPADRPG